MDPSAATRVLGPVRTGRDGMSWYFMGVNGFLRNSSGDLWASIGHVGVRQQSEGAAATRSFGYFSKFLQLFTGFSACTRERTCPVDQYRVASPAHGCPSPENVHAGRAARSRSTGRTRVARRGDSSGSMPAARRRLPCRTRLSMGASRLHVARIDGAAGSASGSRSRRGKPPPSAPRLRRGPQQRQTAASPQFVKANRFSGLASRRPRSTSRTILVSAACVGAVTPTASPFSAI